MISCGLRLVLHVIRVQQGDEVRVAVGYLCQVILVRKHGVPIGIGQRESVLEVTGDVLPLESGILDIARLNLLIKRTIRELSDRLSRDMCALSEEEREGPEDQHDSSNEEENLPSSPGIIAWTTAIAAVVGALPSTRTLLLGGALVQMCNLSIHRLIRFLCDR